MAAAGIAGKPRASAQRHRRENTDERANSASESPKTHVNKRPSVDRPPRTSDVAATMRGLQAIDLIVAGYTYAEAAKQVGYASPGACHNAVQRELARYAIPKVEAMRKVHFLRIEQLYKVYHAKALKGDGWSAGRALDQLARQAKLMDLDLTRDEQMAAMPYQKRIVLEDAPSVPAIGEVLE